MRIRHYGLLGNRHRAENLARCRELLAVPVRIAPPEPELESTRSGGLDRRCLRLRGRQEMLTKFRTEGAG